MTQDKKAKIDRRDLLRVLGAGAAVSPVALVGEAHADEDMCLGRTGDETGRQSQD